MMKRYITVILGLYVLINIIIIGCSSSQVVGPDKKQMAKSWYKEVFSFRGRGHTESGLDINPEKSFEYLEKAIELDPQFAEAWSAKGEVLCYLEKGTDFRYDEALKSYDKATELNPKLLEAWRGKGFVLHLLHRYEEAIKAFDKAIELDSKSTVAGEIWEQKSWEYYNLKKYDEAIRAIDEAIKIKPSFIRYMNKVIWLSFLEKWDDIIKVWDEYIMLNPTDAEGWYRRSGTYSYHKKNKQHTLSNLAKAISLSDKYKEEAKKSEAFQWLWNDEDFKKLTR